MRLWKCCGWRRWRRHSPNKANVWSLKVPTITTSGGFLSSSLPLSVFCPIVVILTSPLRQPYLCLYLTICLWPSLTLKYQQCAERETTERRGRKGGVEAGRAGGREGKTDEGRTAAGGCHGNREDCYTAHVNRQLLMGGIGGGGGTQRRRQWVVSMNDCLLNTHHTGVGGISPLFISLLPFLLSHTHRHTLVNQQTAKRAFSRCRVHNKNTCSPWPCTCADTC